MNDENKITGPGYYPRRPGPPINAVCSFEGEPYRIKLYGPTGRDIGGLMWRGSGEYRPNRLMYPQAKVASWAVTGGRGKVLASGVCAPRPATEFVLHLHCSGRPQMLSRPTRWSFIPEIP